MKMDQMKMAKQMVEFNKTAVGNGFNAMFLLQDQTEKMINSILEQAPWIPEEWKKVISEWGTAYKRGRDELKKAVDEGFERLESYFGQSERSENV